MSDYLEDLMTTSIGASSPPQELLEQARQEAPSLRARRRARLVLRGTAIGAVLVMLTAVAFTEPGRAATNWIANLAGVGDEPTLTQVGTVPGSAVVLKSGELPDGTPYELVAKKVTEDSFLGQRASTEDRGRPRIPPAVCFQLDWPTIQGHGGGGTCTDSPYSGKGNDPPLEASSFLQAPDASRLAPGVFSGIADDSRIARVEITSEAADGERSPVDSSLLTLDTAALRRLGAEHPVSVFFAVLGSEDLRAAADRKAQVTARAFDSSGVELDSTDAFAPLSCPLHPPKLDRNPPPVERPDVQPTPMTPTEIKEAAQAIKCQAGP